ncbi:protein of unknown function [Xenorhabdus poinarii G6]|uniref:Uncharacterized protein n=1 Tax=Xenorhabdus poinarii G6 TaxID=1354304 RepID=A0A068QYW0_9GAMM|nr:protein of unknown function [Xenorhabdus poinarii G6]
MRSAVSPGSATILRLFTRCSRSSLYAQDHQVIFVLLSAIDPTQLTQHNKIHITPIGDMIIKKDRLSLFRLSISAYCVYHARFVISTGATGFEL